MCSPIERPDFTHRFPILQQPAIVRPQQLPTDCFPPAIDPEDRFEQHPGGGATDCWPGERIPVHIPDEITDRWERLPGGEPTNCWPERVPVEMGDKVEVPEQLMISHPPGNIHPPRRTCFSLDVVA